QSRRAESGEGGLEQVQADERGQQPPPWGHQLGQGHADEDHHAGESHDRAIEGHGSFHCLSPWGWSGLSRSMPSRPRTYFSYTGSDVRWRILQRKYFSNAMLATCTHLPIFVQVTLRGGVCGSAAKAAPVPPVSARQAAFQVPSKSAGSPARSAWMLRTMVVTIDSIMKPVLGAPVATGVASTGGIATHTPAAKMRGWFGLRWCLSTMTKPRGLHSPSTAATASTPRKAGSSIAYLNGKACSRSGWPCASCSTADNSPAPTAATLALTIQW